MSAFLLPLWALVWHYVVLVVLIVLCVVWFICGTFLKKLAAYLGFGLFIGLLFAIVYTKLGADYEQGKCVAEQAQVQSTVDTAVRSAIPAPGSVQHDKFDEDYKSQSGLRGFSWPHPLRFTKPAKPGLRRPWPRSAIGRTQSRW